MATGSRSSSAPYCLARSPSTPTRASESPAEFDVTKLLELNGIVKKVGSVIALNDVSFDLQAGEIHCLLGDNGAGKSTLIRIISGYYVPTAGSVSFEGQPVQFTSPRDALNRGIGTVYQDLALVPLMSVTRNFFMGREPFTQIGPFKHFKKRYAEAV